MAFKNKKGSNTKNCWTWCCGARQIKTNVKIKNNFHCINSLVVPQSLPNQNNCIVFKADSGASKHYVRAVDKSTLSNISINNSKMMVVLPDNSKTDITQQGNLNLHSKLSIKASKSSILPNLKNS